ncbi:MAG: ATP-dependent helicase [Thermoprotei archaeon ex4572_64]|nr:MAG: ATP-dependent helicase [Thermoprotei archaeon ex4572_64]
MVVIEKTSNVLNVELSGVSSEDLKVINKLHPKVISAIVKRGFKELTPPQRLAIPKILNGKNVLIIAPTGSGKTEAAILPIFSLFLKNVDEGEINLNDKGIYILYITPLRALNRDLLDRLNWWCSELGIKIDVRHGDTEQSERVRQSRDPPHILITTPETLQAILTGRRLRMHLAKLRWIIIDEVHELAEDKRGTQLALTLERIKWLIGRKPQIVGLSATVGSPEVVGKFLVGNDSEIEIVNTYFSRDMKLDVIHPEVSNYDKEVSEKVLTHAEVISRLRTIRDLIDKYGSTIVFVNTRSMAELLAFRFNMLDNNYPISVHHSSLSKISRTSIERAFKQGELKAVIATSSLELGIDIGHVNLVVQYLSPHQVVRLVQRVGRSGHRLDKVPRGYVITTDLNDTLEAIVIVNKVRRGELEPTKIPEKPYDVLCHQVVSLLLIKNRWKVKEVYNIFRNAYPYRDLSIEELRGILHFMSNVLNPRLVYYIEEDDVVVKPRSTKAKREMFKYFFNNLSMIPDEKQYVVIDTQKNEPIGILDEAFIAEYGVPGIKFVFRGRVWNLQKIEEDKVYVIEAKDPIGAIPSWVGEEIPVPFEIAQEVGRIKRTITEMLVRGYSTSEIINKLSRALLINEDTLRYVVAKIKEHHDQKIPIPTDTDIVIEKIGDIVIIHTHFGTLVNRTLARLVSEVLSDLIEYPVGVQQDAYSIVIQLPKKYVGIDMIAQVLNELAKMSDKKIINTILKVALKSGLFKRRFIHVSRRFNIIHKDADLNSINLTNLIDALKNTPVFTEALKEFLTKDLDLDTTGYVLTKIARGEYRVVTIELNEPSPLGKEVIDKISHKLELIAPERLDKLILESIKSRLLNDINVLVCLNCYWYGVLRNKELEESVKCPKCRSSRVGVVKIDEDKIPQLIQSLKEGRVKSSMRNFVERVWRTSEIISKYGKLGVIALSSRLSIEIVEKILNQAHDLDELVRKVHYYEKEEVKKRIFQ